MHSFKICTFFFFFLDCICPVAFFERTKGSYLVQILQTGADFSASQTEIICLFYHRAMCLFP